MLCRGWCRNGHASLKPLLDPASPGAWGIAQTYLSNRIGRPGETCCLPDRKTRQESTAFPQIKVKTWDFKAVASELPFRAKSDLETGLAMLAGANR